MINRNNRKYSESSKHQKKVGNLEEKKENILGSKKNW